MKEKNMNTIMFLEIFLVVSLFLIPQTLANGIASNLEKIPDPGLSLDRGNCLWHARRLLNRNVGVKISPGRGGGSFGGSRGGGSFGGSRGGGGSIGGSRSRGGSRGGGIRGGIIGGLVGAGAGTVYHRGHSNGSSNSNAAPSTIPMKLHAGSFSSLIFLILVLS